MNAEPVPDSGDVRYVVSNYHTLEVLCSVWDMPEDRVRQEIERGLLPRATYVLGNGLEYFPRDYFIFPSMTRPSNRKETFRRRLMDAHERSGLPLSFDESEETWNDYLSGAYGACLFIVLPETITRKAALIGTIEKLTAKPQPHDDDWRNALSRAVETLDALLRPFTQLDRALAGRPVSRDRFVTDVRARFLSTTPLWGRV